MKWHKVVYATLVVAVLLGSAMVLPAIAQVGVNPPQDNIPGSFLVFPLFDISSGHATTIRITDTSGGNVSGPGSGPFSVRVHFDVICRTGCLQKNSEVSLTFHETAEIEVADIVSNPLACSSGYIIAFAEDATTSFAQPISYNNLIGSYHVGTTADDSATYGGNAIAFQANAPTLPGSTTPPQIGNCPSTGGAPPFAQPCDDIQLSFGAATSNDYVAFPRYLLSNFQAEEPGVKTELVLLTLPDRAPNAGGTSQQPTINYWNENEQINSIGYPFTCWDRIELNTLDQHFNAGSANNQLGSDTGSMKIIHTGLPVLGVIIETGPDGGVVARNMQHMNANPGTTTYRPE